MRFITLALSTISLYSTAYAFSPLPVNSRVSSPLKAIRVPEPPAEGDRVILDGPDGEPIIVAKVGGQLYSTAAKCPHLGLPMKKGKINAKGPDGAPEIVCSFHNSCFSMKTGKCNKWVTGALGIESGLISSVMSKVGSSAKDIKAYSVNTDDKGNVSVA